MCCRSCCRVTDSGGDSPGGDSTGGRAESGSPGGGDVSATKRRGGVTKRRRGGKKHKGGATKRSGPKQNQTRGWTLPRVLAAADTPEQKEKQRVSREAASDVLARDGAPNAPQVPTQALTFTTLENLLGRVLTVLEKDDPRRATHMHIFGSVYIHSNQLEVLENATKGYWCTFDPKTLGVEVGTTEVLFGGKKHRVVGYDHGEYVLEGSTEKIRQWELLGSVVGDHECVSLEEDQRMLVLWMVAMYTIVISKVIPYLSDEKSKVSDGRARYSMRVKLLEEKREATKKQLLKKAQGVKNCREACVEVFGQIPLSSMTHGKVSPFKGGLGEGEKQRLTKYVEEEGSLLTFNYMTKIVGDMVDTDCMYNLGGAKPTGMKKVKASFEKEVNHVLRMLSYAQRLGRFPSVHESQHPICPMEETFLREYNSCWRESFGVASTWDVESYVDILEVSSRDLPRSLRLSLARHDSICPNLAVASIEEYARDTVKYGDRQPTTKHNSTFVKLGKSPRIVQFAVSPGYGSGTVAERITRWIMESTKTVQKKYRSASGKKERENNGGTGTDRKTRRGRCPPRIRGIWRDLRETVTRNGYTPLKEAVLKVEKDLGVDRSFFGEDGWAFELLCKAKGPCGLDGGDHKERLRKNPELGETDLPDGMPSNEGHLRKYKDPAGKRSYDYGPQIDELLKGLQSAGVTEEMWSVANMAAVVVEIAMGIPMRVEDITSRPAGRVFCEDPQTMSQLLCGDFKTDGGHGEDQPASRHDIDGVAMEMWMLQLIIGRAFMRRKGHVVTEFMGPMGKDGKQLGEERLNKVLVELGEACLHIPRYSTHIMRDLFITGNIDKGIRQYGDVSKRWLRYVAQQMRTSYKVSAWCRRTPVYKLTLQLSMSGLLDTHSFCADVLCLGDRNGRRSHSRFHRFHPQIVKGHYDHAESSKTLRTKGFSDKGTEQVLTSLEEMDDGEVDTEMGEGGGVDTGVSDAMMASALKAAFKAGQDAARIERLEEEIRQFKRARDEPVRTCCRCWSCRLHIVCISMLLALTWPLIFCVEQAAQGGGTGGEQQQSPNKRSKGKGPEPVRKSC